MLQQEIRGNLAKLLATENLIVEHRRVNTASFDVDRRVLTLPNWDRASKIVYDMLVGHEVGHALFTPNDDWTDRTDAPKDYVNVIEDARIEKLMKRKYPGLKKSFAGGYRELNDQDFFGIANEDLGSLSLIDRINLHFKCGADAMIPFSIEEKLFVARTDLAETFEEVLQIAADVYEFAKSQKVAETPVQSSPQGSSENGSQQSEGQTETQKSDKSDNQESETEKGEEGEEGQGGEGDGQGEELENEGLDYDDHTIGQGGGDHSDHCETQRAFDGNSNDLSNPHVENPIYVELPTKLKTEDYVADWTEIHDWIDSQRAEATNYSYDFADEKYREFRKQSQKEVNYLVKEFECKKSAAAYARAAQSKTGVLDTSKLHTYLYNEDLFKKVTLLPDGKNHGMIFLLDWSGSMSREILDTVKQLINLTSFCKKVQIPFEVYGFTNDWVVAERAIQNDLENYDYYAYKKENAVKNEVYINDDWFHLVNFISSRSNGKDYERMCRNLWREASYYRNYTNYQYTIGLQLSGTPLNEAIVMMNYIIPNFQKQNDLQKVNLCILSDGEGCTTGYGREIYDDYADKYKVTVSRLDWSAVLRDRTTGRTYEGFEYDNITNIFIQQLRDRNPDVNVIGFRILDGTSLSGFVGRYANFDGYSEVQKQWKKEKSAIIKNPKAYSALYAINGKSLNKEIEFDVESGAQKGAISKAFKKMLGNKSTNKKLLSSFIGYVS